MDEVPGPSARLPLLVVLTLSTWLARRLGFSVEDEITTVFCGSKKTLASGVPMAKLLFDYGAYGTQISTLKNYRGKSGWISVSLLSVEALGNFEERLVVAAVTVDGSPLAEDDPSKLLRLLSSLRSSRLCRPRLAL